MKYSKTMFVAALLGAGFLQAQTGPLIAELKQNYQGIKNDVTKVAEKMKEAFDYCDPVYNGLTEASATEMIKMFGRDRSRFGVLNFGVIHNNEMYGQMVVYLRMKGLVPPSSEPRGGGAKKE